MIKSIFLIYFSVGLLLILIGPAGKSIQSAVREVKHGAKSNPRTGRKPVPIYKLRLFELIITIGFITLWPFFLPGVLKEKHK